ncbi:hypothetical protein F5141DRAFT_721398 [Pisolithus sp. B1]|nr:hypothetical protein F5141DRAFT_721398 [Pisolithus sp. B1]
MTQLSHGIYKFVNRQSGTAMDVVGDSVVGMPPSSFMTQQWEIIPSGDGYMIQNVETQKYLSFQTLFRTSPVLATRYPTAWDINRVYLPNENAVFYEIRWPHSNYLFDLAGGDSAPKTRIQIMDESLEPHSRYDRCRLWRAAKMYDSTGPVLPPLTSVRSFDMAPEPTTGTGTMMGAARTRTLIPALRMNGGPVSHGRSAGDQRRVTFATPVGMHSSGLGTQDMGGQTMSRNEDGRHAATVERKDGKMKRSFRG